MKKLLTYIVFTLSLCVLSAQETAVEKPEPTPAAASANAPDSKDAQAEKEKLADEHAKKLKDAYTSKENEKSVSSALIKNKFIRKSIEEGLSSNITVLKTFGITPEDYSTHVFGNITYLSLIAAGLLFVLNTLIGFLVIKVVYPLLLKLSKRRKWPFLEDILNATRPSMTFFFGLVIAYTCLIGIFLEIGLVHYFQTVFSTLFLGWVLWILVKLFDVISQKIEKVGIKKFGFKELFPVIRKTLRLLLIIFLVLYFLDECGFKVGSIIVSLGIGGAALAFASKDTIANFFGSVSLIMDSPFKIGDRIQVQDKFDGCVENIGLRSTRIRNLDQTLSILPNSYLANEYIINISKWKMRKYTVNIGVTYNTTAKQIKAIISDIEEMLKKDPFVNQQSTQDASFAAFDDSSLRITLLCFINETEYVPYMKAVQRINFALMDIVERNGSSFAFPSHSIYMENTAK